MPSKPVGASRPSCMVSAQGDEHHALWSANPLATGEISVTKHFCSISANFSRCQDLTFARFTVDYSVNKVILHFYSSPCLQGVIFLSLMASALIFGPSVATCLKLQSNPQIKLKVMGLHSLSRERKTDALKKTSTQTSFSVSEEQSMCQWGWISLFSMPSLEREHSLSIQGQKIKNIFHV